MSLECDHRTRPSFLPTSGVRAVQCTDPRSSSSPRPRPRDRGGGDVDADPARALRALQLTGATERRCVATSLRNILEAADERHADPASPVRLNHADVLAARHGIVALIEVLRSEQTVTARGVALARLLTGRARAARCCAKAPCARCSTQCPKRSPRSRHDRVGRAPAPCMQAAAGSDPGALSLTERYDGHAGEPGSLVGAVIPVPACRRPPLSSHDLSRCAAL